MENKKVVGTSPSFLFIIISLFGRFHSFSISSSSPFFLALHMYTQRVTSSELCAGYVCCIEKKKALWLSISHSSWRERCFFFLFVGGGVFWGYRDAYRNGSQLLS